MTRLSDRDRLRLAWYYQQGMTLAQIGRLCHEHEATVSRHLSRTRKALRVDVEAQLQPLVWARARSTSASRPRRPTQATRISASCWAPNCAQESGGDAFQGRGAIVSSNDPRDRAIEAALRKGAAPLPASPECLDAETLAAWADGGLGQRALARAEAHMASCARCQTVMATLVSSHVELEPAPACASGPRVVAHRPALDGPAGRCRDRSAAVDGSARDRPGVRHDSTTGPRHRPVEPGPARVRECALSGVALTRRVCQSKATEEKLARTEPAARQERPEEREVTERARRTRRRANSATDLLAKAEDRSAPVAGVAPAAPPVRQNRADAEADRAAPAPAAAAPRRRRRRSAPRRVGARGDGGSAIDLSSRDSVVRWRLAGPGIVERSSDGGSSWERLDTGTRTVLAAGSCPSASVCWVVGRAGAVLLTTDARAWRRRPRHPPKTCRGGREGRARRPSCGPRRARRTRPRMAG